LHNLSISICIGEVETSREVEWNLKGKELEREFKFHTRTSPFFLGSIFHFPPTGDLYLAEVLK
jgi:hypothetical protein